MCMKSIFFFVGVNSSGLPILIHGAISFKARRPLIKHCKIRKMPLLRTTRVSKISLQKLNIIFKGSK